VLVDNQLMNRWVRWPGSMGDYFVMERIGTSPSRRPIYLCVVPRSRNVLPVMLGFPLAVLKDLEEPREAQLYREHEEE
jgi:hypothetical protein